MAWDLHISRLQHMDSTRVADWLKNDVNLVSNMQNLLVATRELINRGWIVEVIFVYREANRVADAMASTSLG